MANFLETIVNKYIPPEYKTTIKNAIRNGDSTAAAVLNSAVIEPIREIRQTATDLMSGNYNEELTKFLINLSTQPIQRQQQIMNNPEVLAEALVSFIPIGAAGAIAKGLSVAFRRGGIQGATRAAQGLSKSGTTGTNLSQIVSNSWNKFNDTVTGRIADRASQRLQLPQAGQTAGNNWDRLISAIKNKIDNAKIGDDVIDVAFERGTTQSKKYINLLKDNSKQIFKLAKLAGVNSKAEIPRLMKFVDELGTLLKNSPNWIKATATRGGVPLLANAGLSVYDMYQAFKDNDDTLLPRTAGNAARLGLSLLPAKGVSGNIIKMLYSNLGYLGAGGLVQAAQKAIGLNTSNGDKDYDTGYAYQNLGEYVPDEYLTGISGRKYHRVGDKIYDFATGKPVKIDEALRDADQYNIYQRQQKENQLQASNDRIQNLEALRQLGYNISNEELQNAYAENDALYTDYQDSLNATQNPFSSLFDYNYDPNGDLVQQYYNNEVLPQKQQAAAQQQLMQQSIGQTYRQVFDKIAQDTYSDIDSYFTPENLAIDYSQEMLKAGRGESVYLSPERYAEIRKAQAMYQLGPQIRDRALETMRAFEAADIARQNLGMDYQDLQRKQLADVETRRKNRATEAINLYKANETARHNRNTENINRYNASTRRNLANVAAQNAYTNRLNYLNSLERTNILGQAEERLQRVAPYSQAQMMGTALSGATMGGLTPDQFFNVNQSLMQQVFPQAFNNPQQQQYQSWNLPPQDNRR